MKWKWNEKKWDLRRNFEVARLVRWADMQRERIPINTQKAWEEKEYLLQKGTARRWCSLCFVFYWSIISSGSLRKCGKSYNWKWSWKEKSQRHCQKSGKLMLSASSFVIPSSFFCFYFFLIISVFVAAQITYRSLTDFIRTLVEALRGFLAIAGLSC